MERHDDEHGGVPSAEDHAFEFHVAVLAACKHRAGIAGLRDGCFDERTEVTAAVELVLDAETTLCTKITRPLVVDFSLQIERPFLVCDVPGRDDKRKANPEQERIHGEERAVVEEDARPADK